MVKMNFFLLLYAFIKIADIFIHAAIKNPKIYKIHFQKMSNTYK